MADMEVIMNIAVCVKQVLATDARIRIDSSGTKIDRKEVTLVLNPYDEYAVEEAIKLKEKFTGEVTAITIGPDRANEMLRICLAMGVDKAIRIKSDEVEGLDSFSVSSILSDILKKNNYDIILFGKQTVDDDNAAVGIQVAELLKLPHVSLITKLEISEDKKNAKVEREIEGGKEIIECSLPAVFTAQKGLNDPRYPSLPGIMKAKKKPLEEIEIKDKIESTIKVVDLSLPSSRKTGKIFQGDIKEGVKELVKYLHSEIKII